MFFFSDSGQVLTGLCQRLQSIQPRASVPKQAAAAIPARGGLRTARDSANTVPVPAAVTVQVQRGCHTSSWAVRATTEPRSQSRPRSDSGSLCCAVRCRAKPRAPPSAELHGKHWCAQRPRQTGDPEWRGAGQRGHRFPWHRLRGWGCPTEGQAEFWGTSGGRGLAGTQIWGDVGWSHTGVTRQCGLGKLQWGQARSRHRAGR